MTMNITSHNLTPTNRMDRFAGTSSRQNFSSALDKRQSVDIDGGSGDDTIHVDSRGRGPIHVDGGSGDDVIVVGPGNHGGADGRNDESDPIAAKETGRIWNDPMFKGGDGGRYDIQGEAGKTYNLLSDSGLQVNGRFDKFGSDGTCVGETGITVVGFGGKTSEVNFNKDGVAKIDGQEMQEGQLYTLADGGTAMLKGKELSVTTAEGYTINQTAKGWGDNFINMEVKTGAGGVGHGQLPDGLLGQTFDADNIARNGKTGKGAQGEGAIDGHVQDYETGALFNTPKYQPDRVVVDGGSGDDWIEVDPRGRGSVEVNGGSGDDVIIVGPTRPDPNPPAPAAPVAANEHGRIWGDPHFIGGDGGKYDVQGEAGKIYDLLSDSNLQLRGQFDDWGNGATVVGETGLTVGDRSGKSDHINFRKDGTARINGRQMEQGQVYELADGGTAKLEGKTLTITTAEGYTIKQEAKGKGGKAHINIDVNTGANGVDNGQMPGGLLGQTFDADSLARNGKTGKGAQGEGAIEGKVQDYEVPALDPMNDNRGRGADKKEEGELKELIDQMMQLFNRLLQLLNGQNVEPAKPTTHTNGGSGDDRIEVYSDGDHHVDGGSGDDDILVDFDGTGNNATIHGGSGQDTVTLDGSIHDYTINREGEYTTYTDRDGNAIRVANDVENVEFTEPVFEL